MFARSGLLLVATIGWLTLSVLKGQSFDKKDSTDTFGSPIRAANIRRQLLQTDQVSQVTTDGDPLDALLDVSGDNSTDDNPNVLQQCQPPAIEQFPQPLMDKKARQKGGVIIHIAVALYMFLGLAIVCDDYFVPALDKISEVFNLSPDVAGATFMAAGSSGPELATAVIGVFVAKDDIGISGVIGSAIFNITLVIAVCALAAEHTFTLSWYSVLRDCSCYLISTAILLAAIADEKIYWYESLVFLLAYVLYCVMMGFNTQIESAIGRKIPVPQSWRDVDQSSANKGVISSGEGGNAGNGEDAKYKSMGKHQDAGGGGFVTMECNENGESYVLQSDTPHQTSDPQDKRKLKEDAGKLDKLKWIISYPIYTLSMYTIPDCRKEAWANCYPLTFMAAIVWISAYSYMMVWMITVIGFTLTIPDTVMGLTFIAAGVSVPDALSGIAVIREGHGDMAVSNAIGSNVFDILMCLGLPWFIATTMVDPGGFVAVQSKGMIYSTLSLFATVVFLVGALHFNYWRLNKKFGAILLVWYFIFMTFASLYELNFFGNVNPPQCVSNF